MSIALAKSEVEMSSSTSPSAPFAFGNGASGEANQVQDTPLTIKKSHGFTSSAKKESTTTPRTEASTPGSNADELDLEDDDVDVAMNDNALHRALKNCDSKDAKDEDLQHDGEMPLSQTDQHIHQLDRDGELNEVAGSQSLLSQELLYHNMDGSGSEYGDEDRNLLLSQETESSLSMAKRIGLLSSTQDEESDNEEDGKPAAQEPSTPKRSAGGFSLLSRSISSGAPDLASFSAKKEVIASEGKPRMDITDTPVRESEGFGSLLDAVAKITEQEGSEGEDALAWRRASYLAPPDTFEDIEQDMSSSPTRRKRSATAKRSAASLSPTRKSPRKPVLKRKIPMALPSSGTIKKRKTSQSIQKRKSKTENSDRKKATQSKKKMDDAKEAQLAAKRAAALAERAITDPVLAKRLLLSMALVRENPRSAPEVLPGAGHIIVEGFVWAHYPPLEIGKWRHHLVVGRQV